MYEINYLKQMIFKFDVNTQLVQGIKFLHNSGLVHRNIKSNNILLHSPPGSGRVYAKISDFGFNKKEDPETGVKFLEGNLPFMAPELFKKNIKTTQKIDIYSLGVTFYNIITHENPIQASSYEQYQIMMAQMKCIERPSIIKDDLLWDFLSKLLEFDPNKRLSADEALLHPYLTGSEASSDISDNQMELASLAIKAEKNGDKNITEFNKNQLYIIASNEIKQYFSDIEIEKNQSSSIQTEHDLTNLDLSFDQIESQLNQFMKLSLLERDVLLIFITKKIQQDQEYINQLLENDLVDKYLKTLFNLPLQQIYPIVYNPLLILIKSNPIEMKELLIKNEIQKWINGSLDCKDEQILLNALQMHDSIVCAFDDSEDSEDENQNPLREEMLNVETSEKLFQICLENEYQDKKINQQAAISIGFLFKATPLPTEYAQLIINQLKHLTLEINSSLSYQSILSLICISESSDNHEFILTDGFLADINKILQGNMKMTIFPIILQLLINIYQYGTIQSQSNIEQEISANYIISFSYYANKKMEYAAIKLIKLICDENMNNEEKENLRNNENILKRLQQQAKGQSAQIRMKMIIEDDALKVISKVIHQSIVGEYDWYSQYVSQQAFYTADILIQNNYEAIPYAFNEDGIIDQIASYLAEVTEDQIQSAAFFLIGNIISLCSRSLIAKMIEKGILQQMKKFLNINNELFLRSSNQIIFKLMTKYGKYFEQEQQIAFREDFEKDGTLAKLIEIFQNQQYEDKDINLFDSLSIACLYKATPLPNQIGPSIINNLKDRIYGSANEQIPNILQAISFLAECEQNHQQILSDEFIQQIEMKLENSYNEQFILNSTKLIITLSQFGSTQTEIDIKKEISLQLMIQLQQHPNLEIQSASKTIQQILTGAIIKEDLKQQLKNIHRRIIQIQNEFIRKDKEGKKNMIKIGILKEIYEILHIALNGEIHWMKYNIIKDGCNTLYDILTRLDEAIIHIYENQDLNQGHVSQIDPNLPINEIKLNCDNTNNYCFRINEEQKIVINIVENGIHNTIKKIIDCMDQITLLVGLQFLFNVFKAHGNNAEVGQPNPIQEEMNKDGITTNLIEIFNYPKFQNKEINSYSACSIGCLFKATQLPSEFGISIINELVNIKSNNPQLISDSFAALLFLAELESHHELILSKSFLNRINKELIFTTGMIPQQFEIQEQKYINILHLLINLYKFGSKQTKQIILNQLNIDRIKQLMKQQYQEINEFAQKFLDLVNQSFASDKKEDQENHERIEDIYQQSQQSNITIEKQQMIQSGVLKETSRIIHQSLEEEISFLKLHTIKLACQSTLALVQDNQQAVPFALEQEGIADELISLPNKFQINEIQDFHLDALFHLINNSSPEQKQQFINKGVLKAMRNALNNKDESVLYWVTNILQNVIYTVGQQEAEGKENPLREQMEKDGTINRLIEIFNDFNYKNEYTINFITIAVGYIYKAAKVPKEFGNDIINYLKKIIFLSKKQIFIINSLVAISCLAEIEDNHQLILADNSILAFNAILNDANKLQQHEFVLLIFIKLIKYITDQEEKNKMKQNIPIDIVNQLSTDQHPEIAIKAVQLLKIINGQENLNDEVNEQFSQQEIRMRKIKEEGEGKSPEERLKIIEQGGLKEICKVIHEQLEGELNQNKQYIIQLGCEAASIILKENDDSFPFAIEEGGIIDEIIYLLIKLPIENIKDIHIDPLANIINILTFKQKRVLQQIGIMKPLKKLLSSENENILNWTSQSIYKICYAVGYLEGGGKPNPLREKMERDGTVEQLFGIIQGDKYKDKYIRGFAACSVGVLYKSAAIPTQFYPAVILIKEQALGADPTLSQQSIKALEFSNQILKSQESQIFVSLLNLYINIVDSGTNKTVEQILKQMNISLIIQLQSSSNKPISENADYLIKLINYMIKKMKEAKSEISDDEKRMKEIYEYGKGKSPEERLKIIEQGRLKEICKVIHEQLEGQLNQNKQQLLQLGCKAASALLKENDDSFSFAVEEGGIIDEIVSLFSKLPIENINEIHINPLVRLSEISNFEQRKILSQKGVLKSLTRSLNSTNEDLLNNSTYIFQRIIFGVGDLEGKGKPNPLLKEMERDGTVIKLVEVFQNDKYENKDINVWSACSVGRLYKANQIPSEFGPTIVKELQDLVIGNDLSLSRQAIITITCLVESQLNHNLILAGEFLLKLNQILNNEDEDKEYLKEFILQLIAYLFQFGNNDSKEQIEREIDSRRIIQLSTNENENINKYAIEILQQENEYNKTTKKEQQLNAQQKMKEKEQIQENGKEKQFEKVQEKRTSKKGLNMKQVRCPSPSTLEAFYHRPPSPRVHNSNLNQFTLKEFALPPLQIIQQPLIQSARTQKPKSQPKDHLIFYSARSSHANRQPIISQQKYDDDEVEPIQQSEDKVKGNNVDEQKK